MPASLLFLLATVVAAQPPTALGDGITRLQQVHTALQRRLGDLRGIRSRADARTTRLEGALRSATTGASQDVSVLLDAAREAQAGATEDLQACEQAVAGLDDASRDLQDAVARLREGSRVAPAAAVAGLTATSERLASEARELASGCEQFAALAKRLSNLPIAGNGINREAIGDMQKDKKYWMSLLDMMNKVAEELGDYLKELNDASMKDALEIISPKPHVSLPPKGSLVEVRFRKDSIGAAAPSKVSLKWEAKDKVLSQPTVGAAPLPTELALSPTTAWPSKVVAASAALDFTGQPHASNWTLRACVNTGKADLCHEVPFSVYWVPVSYLPSKLRMTGPASKPGSPADGSPADPTPGSAAIPGGLSAGLPRGAAPSVTTPPGPVAAVPPPGISGGLAQPLRLIAVQQRGPSDLLLVFQTLPGGADAPPQSVEVRLGGRAIGRGRLPGLAAQQQAQVVVHFELPAGARGPVDLEVWVGSARVGSARVTPVVRAR